MMNVELLIEVALDSTVRAFICEETAMKHNSDIVIQVKELQRLEEKARSGACTGEEHRLIFLYRYLLGHISSDIYWTSET